ncbi:MAG: arylmalonate decarboxylase, partial [Acidobacteriia bacterium]|nr:arylmalonate decarboxylase [Terriglobia bacterium]
MNLRSRREFLQIGGAAACAALARAADPVLGMIFPPANYPVPPEAPLLYPNVKFLAEGVGLERMTPEEYDRVFDRILPAAKKQAAQGARAIDVMGTSLTFYKGAAFNQRLMDTIRKETGLPATTMSTGIVEGLHAVGGRRVAVATAYNNEVNRRLGVFLEESGFEVVTVKGLGIERFEDSPPVTHDSLLQFSASVWESAPKADALVVSCGA